MRTTTISDFKKNPGLVLHQAEESPVLVLKDNAPNAVIVHLDPLLTEANQSIRPALAASLFKDGTLSLGAATRLSCMSMQVFLQYLSELGINVLSPDETTDAETRDLSQWLKL